MSKEAERIAFIHQRIMVHIVLCSSEQLRKACELYNVDLEQFKKDHSEEITFALLRQ